MSNYHQTEFILFGIIPPELEAILSEFNEDEINREATHRGTVITYQNRFIANTVYNYIVHYAKNKNRELLLATITPNYFDENHIHVPTFSTHVEDSSPNIVKSYYTHKSPTKSYQSVPVRESYPTSTIVKNYYSHKSPIKNYQRQPLVQNYRTEIPQMSSSYTSAPRQVDSLANFDNSSNRNRASISSRHPQRSTSGTPNRIHHRHQRYNPLRSTHVPVFGTNSLRTSTTRDSRRRRGATLADNSQRSFDRGSPWL